MAKRKVQLADGEMYHVIIRGTDDRKLFIDNKDYYRFVHDLFEFNDSNLLKSSFRINFNKNEQNYNEDVAIKEKDSRKLLIKINAFCLMPNHVHLLLEQIQDKGISRFMHKLCGGYSSHFNFKHKRKGTLFQDRFRSIHVHDDKQLAILFTYIHTNPIALITKD